MPLELDCWLKVPSVLNRWLNYDVDRGTIIASIVDVEGNSHFFFIVFHFLLIGWRLPMNYRYSVILRFWVLRSYTSWILDKFSINLIKIVLLECGLLSRKDYIFETSLIQSLEEPQLILLPHLPIRLDDHSYNLRNALPLSSCWSI